ncbi:MAG: hypothetical protein QGG36_24340 [Pirellulaceae bacterium]|nr:hypothetical protein [Pirellulaceae bacterium]MDP7018949.1 hypothetical protein [Pirellulaceae bacterium]
MFGQPHWFREKTIGWGVTPITWQGWLYSAAWAGAISLPAAYLLVGHALWMESLIWVGASMTALAWDVKQVLRAMRFVHPDDVFVIDEENDVSQKLTTSKFEMHIRD